MYKDSIIALRLLCLVVLVVIVLVFAGSYMHINSATKEQKDITAPKISAEDYNDVFSKCHALYKSQNFDDSAKCFKNLDEQYPAPDTKYMIGISLSAAKEYKDAIKYIEDVVGDDNANTETKVRAQKVYTQLINNISQLDSFERHDIGDYFGDLSQVATWKNPKKIKVWISSDHGKGGAITLAFMKWDDELGSMIDFIYVSEEKDADITAYAVDIKDLPEGTAGETATAYQYYSNDKSKLFMQKAKIKVSYNSPAGTNWNSSEFMGITLHEIGHALGILNHSTHKGDIMYFDVTTYRKGTISNRDINTVKKIYGNI